MHVVRVIMGSLSEITVEDKRMEMQSLNAAQPSDGDFARKLYGDTP
jgi:hypothetical protein